MLDLFKRYRKFIVAALGAAFVAMQAALSDNTVTNAEWVVIGIAILTALGVRTVPNQPEDPPSSFR